MQWGKGCRENIFMFKMTCITTVLLKPPSCGFQIEALKSITQADLVNWFQAHRSNQRKVLSVHVSVWQPCVANFDNQRRAVM